MQGSTDLAPDELPQTAGFPGFPECGCHNFSAVQRCCILYVCGQVTSMCGELSNLPVLAKHYHDLEKVFKAERIIPSFFRICTRKACRTIARRTHPTPSSG